jgi:hypothetical protein
LECGAEGAAFERLRPTEAACGIEQSRGNLASRKAAPSAPAFVRPRGRSNSGV